MIEAEPARALAALAVARQERLAPTLVDHVVLAGDEERLDAGFPEDLVGVVEFLVARQLRDVAGVDDEGGLDASAFTLAIASR